jgi:thiol:disulfide interchange protein
VRLALLAVVVVVVVATGCGKSDVDVRVRWLTDIDAAAASAKAQNKPLFVYFGAQWDVAAKELEHRTFRDPEVSSLLNRRFVSIHVDTTDDEDQRVNALQRHFEVIGDPTVVIVAPDGAEMVRFNQFVPPRALARILSTAAPLP